VPDPRIVPVGVRVVREGMRGRIALGLLLVIAGAVAGAFGAAAWDWASPPDLKDLLTQVYNPLVGLFGAVIGFYFGSMGTRERFEGSSCMEAEQDGLAGRPCSESGRKNEIAKGLWHLAPGVRLRRQHWRHLGRAPSFVPRPVSDEVVERPLVKGRRVAETA
jgi:hypothetical protein